MNLIIKPAANIPANEENALQETSGKTHDSAFKNFSPTSNQTLHHHRNSCQISSNKQSDNEFAEDIGSASIPLSFTNSSDEETAPLITSEVSKLFMTTIGTLTAFFLLFWATYSYLHNGLMIKYIICFVLSISMILVAMIILISIVCSTKTEIIAIHQKNVWISKNIETWDSKETENWISKDPKILTNKEPQSFLKKDETSIRKESETCINKDSEIESNKDTGVSQFCLV